MTIAKSIVAVGAVLTLSACATTPPEPVKALPPEFVDAVMEAALAETIADECRSLRYDARREDKVLSDYAVRLVAAGYTERDLTVAANKMERDPVLQRKAVQMIVDRDINVLSEESWCAAGKREKARRTNIGRYLL